MRYFRGTLSRDGHTLGDVLGEIRLVTEHYDEVEAHDPAGKCGVRMPAGPAVSHWEGSMDVIGWRPTAAVLGSTFQLDADRCGIMNVMVTYIIRTSNEGEPTRLSFTSKGAPIVMPTAPSPVPAASRAPQGATS